MLINDEPFHHSYPLVEVSEKEYERLWRALGVASRYENIFPFSALYDPDQHHWSTTEAL